MKLHHSFGFAHWWELVTADNNQTISSPQPLLSNKSRPTRYYWAQTAQQEIIYNHLCWTRRARGRPLRQRLQDGKVCSTLHEPALRETYMALLSSRSLHWLVGSEQHTPTDRPTGGELIFARFRRRPADCDNGEGVCVLCVRALLFALAGSVRLAERRGRVKSSSPAATAG